ncbi:MAG: rRNA maturation RNase YbeY [Gemmatimonadales bacterium]|nr:MAG: rRNA maturation RNase YbeY [Gemmatimonadales bacterium]
MRTGAVPFSSGRGGSSRHRARLVTGESGDPQPPQLDIVLSSPGREPLPEEALRRALASLLAREGVESGELSVTFLADDPIRELNVRYLAHDWVPDVLSFSLAPPLLGDVYVGYDQARRQSVELAVPLDEELVRLAVHGTLHLLGHEHPDDPAGREDSEMYQLQEAVVREVFG